MTEAKSDNFDPKNFLKTVTTKPGVYRMRNNKGEVIYVGKARNLKKRLQSYFKEVLDSPKTTVMMRHVCDVEVTVTNTENEALLLENNLIKTLKPKYNIFLRDDKSYPYILLSNHQFPRLDSYRGKKKKKASYFGPFPSASAVHETINLLQKLFQLRQCSDSYFSARTRPCLQYQIKRCSAPCVNKITEKDYQLNAKMAKLFLTGQNDALIQDLTQKMNQASDELAFETAAMYRDQIAKLRTIQQHQVISSDAGNLDVIAIAEKHGISCVHLLTIRSGRIIGSRNYFPQNPTDSAITELLTAFITQYYLNPIRDMQIPTRILVNLDIPEKQWISNALSAHANKKIQINHAARGIRADWLKLSIKNAQTNLASHIETKKNYALQLATLQEVLNIDAPIERMECFDISHTQGEATVASCVVFDAKGPLNSAYRRLNITEITPGDDYAAMKQALSKHYTTLKEKELPLPDILFIDGGKGQLRQAQEVLADLQIHDITLVGVSKGPGRKPGLETLHLADTGQKVNLDADNKALLLVLHIRDEAHRFAITGHRKKQRKNKIVSSLEQIDGIGHARRQKLLQHFAGIQGVKAATVEALAKVPGISKSLAEKIYQTLHRE